MGSIISLFKPECGLDFTGMTEQNASSCGKISGGMTAFIIFIIGLFICIVLHYITKKSEEEKPEKERTNKPIIVFLIGIVITIVLSLISFGFTSLYYTSQQKRYSVQIRNLQESGMSRENAIYAATQAENASKLAQQRGYGGSSFVSGALGGAAISGLANLFKK